MLSLVRMVGVSAVLSSTLVTGYNALALGQPPTKPFQQRLGAEAPVSEAPAVLVGLRQAQSSFGRPKACEGQAWPYYDQSCLKSHRAEVPSNPVRWVTVETRPEPATSTLTRVPQTVVAQR